MKTGEGKSLLQVFVSIEDSRNARHVRHDVAILCHIVTNLIRLDTTRNASIETEQLLAATSDQLREESLGLRL